MHCHGFSVIIHRQGAEFAKGYSFFLFSFEREGEQRIDCPRCRNRLTAPPRAQDPFNLIALIAPEAFPFPLLASRFDGAFSTEREKTPLPLRSLRLCGELLRFSMNQRA